MPHAAPRTMRVLLVGAGGHGARLASAAVGRDFYERVVVADYDPQAARQVAALDRRFSRAQVDASQVDDLVDLIQTNEISHLVNAAEPQFAMAVFNAARIAGVDYLDLAGAARELQVIQEGAWHANGRLALVGLGGPLSAVVALELLAAGLWVGTGVLGPEAFDHEPFDALLGEYPGAEPVS